MFGQLLISSILFEASVVSAFPHIAEQVAAQRLNSRMFSLRMHLLPLTYH
jgi:threonine/homoserine efflux transporter RhtA